MTADLLVQYSLEDEMKASRNKPKPRKATGPRHKATTSKITSDASASRPRSKAAPTNGQIVPAQWKPQLDMYASLRAVQFSTARDFAAAAELLWTDQLRDMPYDLAGNRTVLVPAEALCCFDGLSFAATDVLSTADLPPAELAELRRDQGSY